MSSVQQAENRYAAKPLTFGIAAVALCVGLTIGPSHGIAMAETTDTESTSTESVGNGTDTDSDSDSADSTDDKPETGSVDDDAETDPDPETEPDTETETDTDDGDDNTDEPTAEPEPEPEVEAEPDVAPVQADDHTTDTQAPREPVVPDPIVADEVSSSADDTTELEPEHAEVHLSVVDAAALPDLHTVDARSIPVATFTVETFNTETLNMAASTLVVPTTPTPPQPLSPIAQALQLPGQIVNAVLELLDLTTSANSSQLPIDIYSPINNLIFGLFREWERLVGLHQPPPVQPAIPTMTYDGPTTALTPTVAQFLNAATAQYVLGGTPGDLVPFTVDGFQMSETNTLTGMVGTAWVTPQGQVIIAYQGTTGGSNLLFNPLITISQLAADLQVIFTGTTPLAFDDALDFANRVQEEAALQGYAEDDIFVTGHSLGAWEAQYVAQQTGLAGIGFEAPGMNTTVPGNGEDAMFVNIVNYGSPVGFMATDLPGLQPFMPPYVPAGGSKPHYGPIVLIGDPAAATPLLNASQLWGDGLVGSAIFLVTYLGNFIQYHLPGVQAYHLDVTNDPGIVPWLGTSRGTIHEGYGELTIPQLLAEASDDGILVRP